MNVVNQQKLGRAVASAELVRAALGDCSDKFVRELFGRDVDGRLVRFGGVLRNRLKKVSLAEARRTIDVERIVISPGAIRRPERGRRGHTVALGDDETLEGEMRVQPLLTRRARDNCLGREPCFCERQGAVRLAVSMAIASDDLERDLHRTAEDVAQRLADKAAHPRREPFLYELGRHPHDEGAGVNADPFGVLQPGVVVGTRDS